MLRRFLPLASSTTSTVEFADDGSGDGAATRRTPPPHHHKSLEFGYTEDYDETAANEYREVRRMRPTLVHVHQAMRGPMYRPTTRVVPPTSLSASATTVSGSATHNRRLATGGIASSYRPPTTEIRWAIGRKKRAALCTIIACYSIFAFIYILVVLYVLE